MKNSLYGEFDPKDIQFLQQADPALVSKMNNEVIGKCDQDGHRSDKGGVSRGHFTYAHGDGLFDNMVNLPNGGRMSGHGGIKR